MIRAQTAETRSPLSIPALCCTPAFVHCHAKTNKTTRATLYHTPLGGTGSRKRRMGNNIYPLVTLIGDRVDRNLCPSASACLDTNATAISASIERIAIVPWIIDTLLPCPFTPDSCKAATEHRCDANSWKVTGLPTRTRFVDADLIRRAGIGGVGSGEAATVGTRWRGRRIWGVGGPVTASVLRTIQVSAA